MVGISRAVRVVRLVALVMLVTLAFACAGGLATAKSDYRRGRFAEAKSTLVALEEESQSYGGQKRAEYALYRGLVHHALGDSAAAGVWLREAKAIEDVHPHTLSGEDKARLDLALESLSAPP